MVMKGDFSVGEIQPYHAPMRETCIAQSWDVPGG